MRAGCLDCLLDAYRAYQSLRAIPVGLLRDLSQVDELSAYSWVSFMCGGSDARNATVMPTSAIFAAVSTFVDTPLIAFAQATCRGIDGAKLTALAAAEPRFAETAYLLGLRDLGRRKPDEADAQFERAYARRPRWPALTLTIANGAMSTEEFDLQPGE